MSLASKAFGVFSQRVFDFRYESIREQLISVCGDFAYEMGNK
jgi:hypothetical protein